MTHNNRIVMILSAFLMLPGTALATNTVLSGIFDGSESATAPLPGTCRSNDNDPLMYQEVPAFQVSVSGTYTIVDAFNPNKSFSGVDITAVLYEGSFNPALPQTNLITPDGVDVTADVVLNAGTDYVLVVQQWCKNPARTWVSREGAWAVTFSGPGKVSSGNNVTVPEFTAGSIVDSDPTVASECATSRYQQIGPIQVSQDGPYHYVDISINFDVDMCLQIYSAPFDTANPVANQLARFDDEGVLEMETGKDYYFVVQPLNSDQTGEFFYVFAPPSPVRISAAMSGSWFFPDTEGQGFFMDVFDNINLLFLAWFTYDLERPASGVTAMIGEPGHRWMTAIGPLSGSKAELDIYWNSGMVFDSGEPPSQSKQDGTMTVEFFNCFTGLVTYDLGSSGVSGEVPIQRLANDTVGLCQTLTEGPGQPGPL